MGKFLSARLFFAEGGIEQVVEYVAQNKEISVKEKKTFLETLKEIVNKIVDIVKNYVTNNHLKASEKAVGDMSLDDIKKLRTQFLDVIDGAISNLENGVEVGTSTKNSTEVTFKNKISINNNFERDYDKWDKNNPRTVFTIGKTSDALKSIGIKNADIIIDASKLIKIRNDHPEMTDEIIKQIPNIIENPIIVMESKSVNSRVTMFGEVISGKTPILVVLELSPKKKNKIKVASAYGKNNAQNFINSSNILYVDSNKKRVKAWEKRTGLQLPVGSSIPNSNSIISNPNENVNIKKSLDVDSEGNTLSKQQQEYFKESKVRDENGNLLVVYHGTTEDGYIELASGNYENVRNEYERAYNQTNNSVYGNIKTIRTEKGRDIWNMQSSEDGGNVNRNSGQNRRTISESNISTDNEHLRTGNKGTSKQIKKSLDVIHNIIFIFCEAKQPILLSFLYYLLVGKVAVLI